MAADTEFHYKKYQSPLMSSIANWFSSPHIPTIYFPGSTLIVATPSQHPTTSTKIQKFFYTKILHALFPYILTYQA
jgi:hypothetical protein